MKECKNVVPLLNAFQIEIKCFSIKKASYGLYLPSLAQVQFLIKVIEAPPLCVTEDVDIFRI